MSSKSLIELADRKSRLRAFLYAFATLVYVFVQIITRPMFRTAEYLHGWRIYAWAFNAALLLMCLSGGGGVLNNKALRDLINDEVAQSNYRRACAAGFWVAMICGLGLFVLPPFRPLTGPQVLYVLISAATVAAMLTFSWLEYRAHADA